MSELTVKPVEPFVHNFTTLYSDQYVRLVRLAALLTGSTSAAEDVVQDAFAKLYLRLDTVAIPQAWLRVAVVNACKNERRRLGTAQRYASRVASGSTTLDEPVHELIASLRRLPYRQRACVVLRYYVDLPETQIADLLGVRLGTVKSSLHRALARLQTEVQQ